MFIIKRFYPLLLLLLLAGCFQQAGEPYQPASSTEVPLNPSTTDNGGDPATELPPLTVFPATATFPPLTVISPTDFVLPTDEPTPIPFEDETGGIESLPSSTPEPTLESSFDAGGSLDTPPTLDTTTFITPDMPLGPITQEPIASPEALFATTATPSGLITPTAFTETSADGCTYTVQPGDNLFRIAVNNNITLEELRAANTQIVGDLIQPGDQLQIPGCGQDTAVEAPVDTGVEAPPVVEGGGETGTGTVYTVVRGDTLFSIARRFGITVQAIVNANNLTNPNSLTPGQTLVIPPAS